LRKEGQFTRSGAAPTALSLAEQLLPKLKLYFPEDYADIHEQQH
jgi:hypothetical protein